MHLATQLLNDLCIRQRSRRQLIALVDPVSRPELAPNKTDWKRRVTARSTEADLRRSAITPSLLL